MKEEHAKGRMKMKQFKNVFKRVEKKYLLSEETYHQLLNSLESYMNVDEYGLHTICNIYYDTNQYDLIRHSIEKPPYKEKLRIRSYGIPTEESTVFVEIKKKFKGVVYKRRISMPLKKATLFLNHGIAPKENSQIVNEIKYFIQLYHPVPKQYIAYDRIALYGKEDPELRITFDSNIRGRKEDLDLECGDDGEPLLSPGERLMEIKIAGAMPIWLAHLLSELEIYPTSFSKYGNIYKKDVFLVPMIEKSMANEYDISELRGGIVHV